MVIAIEPMFNLGRAEVTTDKDGWTVRTRDGNVSAHFENTVAIGANGAVILGLGRMERAVAARNRERSAVAS
jgi:methionyl aminopeptidase